ncbi:DUF4878 domain-containing protein [Morganella psychrotolerans]|uniref:DUF4878 domain-containing protein n=1 Tax=Morganella psychrotolerans TaxID=368603 RepID=UPI0039B0387C
MLIACGSEPPETVAQQFYSAVEKKDADKAYDLLAIPEKDKKKNEMEIKGKVQMIVGDMAGRIAKNGGVKSTEVKSVDIDEAKKRATVILTVRFNDGKQKDERFLLTQENDDWKVILR